MARDHCQVISLCVFICALSCGVAGAQTRDDRLPDIAPNSPTLPSLASPNPSHNAAVPAAPSGSNSPAALPGGVKDLTPPEFIDIIPPPVAEKDGVKPRLGELPGLDETLGRFGTEQHGFYVDAEFLLLRVRSDNLDYAIPNGIGGLATTGSIHSVEYHETPAFHIELGYRFLNNWDISFGYTYVHSNGDQSVLAGPGESIFPTLTRPGLTDTVSSASASASLDYNVFDLLVGRQFVFDEHSWLRVFGGLRFADITQNLYGQYDGGDAQLAAVTSSSQFRGVGPIVGGELVFKGWQGLNVYARTSAGLIAGASNNSLFETNNGGATLYTDVNYNVQKVVPMASIGLGGGWEYRAFSVRFGYEVTQYFNLTERVRFTDDVAQGPFTSRSGNLSLSGLFIQFAANF